MKFKIKIIFLIFFIAIQVQKSLQQCDGSCATCAVDGNASQCTSCYTNTYLNVEGGPGQCLASGNCPAQHFEKGFPDNTCAACDNTCDTCNGDQANNCLTCSTLFLDSSNQCVNPCPGNTVGISPSQTCETCDTGCATCTGDQATCNTCFAGYFHLAATNTCETSCPDGTYPEGSTPDNCLDCDNTCFTCNQATNTDCLSCDTPLYLLGTECITTCPDGTFGNDTTHTCDSCHIQCDLCHGPDYNTCDTCETGFYWYDLDTACITEPECIALIPARIVDKDDVDGINVFCIDLVCDPTCTTCNQTEFSDCTSCTDVAKNKYLYQTQCLDNCLTNQYADDITRTCYDCHSTCLTCETTEQNCLTCIINYYYLPIQFRCYNPCPDGWYSEDVNFECLECDPICLTCVTDATTCTSCAEGSYLHEADCVTPECPVNGVYQEEVNNECIPCALSCSLNRCSGPLDSDCIDFCTDGYYPNYDNKTCEPCYYACTVCINAPEQCSACQINFKLVGAECVDDCPLGDYFDGTTCQACDGTCFGCSGPAATNCISCTGTRYLDGTNCVTDCSYGGASPTRFGNSQNNLCEDCAPECTSCVNESNECGGCIGTHWLDITLCTQCIDGMYGDQVNNICKDCEDTCFTCNEATNTDCTSCDPARNLYLQINTNKCQSTCDDGYYKDNTDNTCQQCQNGCTKCTGSANYCSECNGIFYFYQNTCINNCPGGYVETTGPNVCYPCAGSCLTCSGIAYNQCTSCEQDVRYLLNNICYLDCPLGYFQDPTFPICSQCGGNCYTCSNDDMNKCYSCQTGYLQDHTCVVECSKGYYANDDVNVCSSCELISEEDLAFCDDTKCPGMEVDSTGKHCVEICGDGIRISENIECDDGNSDSGDGCSDSCLVENGWDCAGGDQNNPDSCIDNRPIGYTLEMKNSTFYNLDQNSELVYNMYFNKTFLLPIGTSLSDYLQIDIDGYKKNLKFNVYGLNRRQLTSMEETIFDENRRELQAIQSTSYQINLILEHTVRNRQIEITIFPKEDFQDIYGNGLALDTTQRNRIDEYIYYSDTDRDASKWSYYVTPMIIFMLVANVFHLFYYDSDGHNKFYYTFLCIDIMQLTYFYRFINIRWPLNGYRFFEYMVAFTDFFVPNLFSVGEGNADSISDIESFNHYFIECAFLENVGGPIMVLYVIVVLFLVLILLTRERFYKNPQNNKAFKIFYQIKNQMFQWGLIIDFFLVSSSVFYLYIFLQFSNLKGGMLNIVTCLVIFTLYTLALLFTSVRILSNMSALYSEHIIVQGNINYKRELRARQLVRESQRKLYSEHQNAKTGSPETSDQQQDNMSNKSGSQGLGSENDGITLIDYTEKKKDQNPQRPKTQVEIAEKQLQDYLKEKQRFQSEKQIKDAIESKELDLDHKLSDNTYRYRNLWHFLSPPPKQNQPQFKIFFVFLITFRKFYTPFIILFLNQYPLAQIILLQLYQVCIISLFFKFGFKIFSRQRDNLRSLISETINFLAFFGFYSLVSDDSEDEESRTYTMWIIICVYMLNLIIHFFFIVVEEVQLFMAYTVNTFQKKQQQKQKAQDEKEDVEYMQEMIEEGKKIQAEEEQFIREEEERKAEERALGKKGFVLADKEQYNELYFNNETTQPQDNQFLAKVDATGRRVSTISGTVRQQINRNPNHKLSNINSTAQKQQDSEDMQTQENEDQYTNSFRGGANQKSRNQSFRSNNIQNSNSPLKNQQQQQNFNSARGPGNNNNSLVPPNMKDSRRSTFSRAANYNLNGNAEQQEQRYQDQQQLNTNNNNYMPTQPSRFQNTQQNNNLTTYTQNNLQTLPANQQQPTVEEIDAFSHHNLNQQQSTAQLSQRNLENVNNNTNFNNQSTLNNNNTKTMTTLTQQQINQQKIFNQTNLKIPAQRFDISQNQSNLQQQQNGQQFPIFSNNNTSGNNNNNNNGQFNLQLNGIQQQQGNFTQKQNQNFSLSQRANMDLKNFEKQNGNISHSQVPDHMQFQNNNNTARNDRNPTLPNQQNNLPRTTRSQFNLN